MDRRLSALSLSLSFLAASWAGGLGSAKAPVRPDPSGLQEIEGRVDLALAENRIAEAIDLLQAGVNRNGGWREGWWRLGTLLYQKDDHSAAQAAFRRLVTLDAKAGAAWVLLGLCEFALGDYGSSLDHLQRGQALGIPAHLELTEVARYHQALGLILTEKYEQAQILLNGLAREDPQNEEVLLAAGLAALHIPQLPKTLAHAFDAARLSLIRQVGEAQALAATKRQAEARQKYQSLIERHPNTSQLHYAYGALLSDLGELEKAETEFRAELRVTPGSVLARIGLAYVGLQKGSTAEALPWAQEAVRLGPRSFMAHYLLGRLLMKDNQLLEGARQLEISRNLNPDSSRVRFALSQAYRRLHRQEEARREQQAFDRLRLLEDSFMDYGKLPASLYEAKRSAGRKK